MRKALSIFSIASRNLLRRPARTASMFFGMAAVSGTLFALTVIYLSVGNSIEAGRKRLGADAMAVPLKWKDDTTGILLSGTPSAFYMEGGIREKIAAVEGVAETAAQLFIVSAPLACCTVSDTMLIGFDPEHDFTISPWLRERLRKPLSDGEVIAGSDILAEPGGRMQFYGREFLMAGKLEPTGMRFIDSSVFIPMEGARRMIAESGRKARKTLDINTGDVSSVLIRFAEGANHEETALRIEYAAPEVKVMLSNDILRAARRNLAMPLKSVLAAGIIHWLSSLFMIGVIYSMSVAERRREIGLLKALGAKNRDVRNLFLYEVLLITGGGVVSGIACGTVFVLGFQNLIRVFFNVPFLLPSLPVAALMAAAVLFLTLASGLAVAFYPALKISSKSPHDVITSI
ncbi:MAG: FtsX-like permease family protein [Thermodesulfovibrionales bacterium]|nr:FtsX-like permease family protein [Thermodesulfovibrionales bacterium]